MLLYQSAFSSPQFHTQVEGEKYLRNLSETVMYEESYIFLPEKQQWIALGKKHISLQQGNRVAIGIADDVTILKKTQTENDALIEYHNHPQTSKALVEAINATTSKAVKEKNITSPDYWSAVFKRFTLERDLFDVFPSDNDISNMIKDSYTFYGEHPSGSIQFKIVSKLGITTYGLTNEGKTHFSSVDQVREYATQKQESLDELLLPHINEITTHLPGSLTVDIIQHTREIAQHLSDSYLKISFVAYDSLDR